MVLYAYGGLKVRSWSSNRTRFKMNVFVMKQQRIILDANEDASYLPVKYDDTNYRVEIVHRYTGDISKVRLRQDFTSNDYVHFSEIELFKELPGSSAKFRLTLEHLVLTVRTSLNPLVRK